MRHQVSIGTVRSRNESSEENFGDIEQTSLLAYTWIIHKLDFLVVKVFLVLKHFGSFEQNAAWPCSIDTDICAPQFILYSDF